MIGRCIWLWVPRITLQLETSVLGFMFYYDRSKFAGCKSSRTPLQLDIHIFQFEIQMYRLQDLLRLCRTVHGIVLSLGQQAYLRGAVLLDIKIMYSLMWLSKSRWQEGLVGCRWVSYWTEYVFTGAYECECCHWVVVLKQNQLVSHVLPVIWLLLSSDTLSATACT